MIVRRSETGGPRTLAWLLLGVVVPPAAALVWLGLQLLLQDRALLSQRASERQQSALDSIVHSLQLSLATAERHLADDPVPAGMVRFRISQAGMVAEPGDRVLWLPSTDGGVQIDNAAFADGEAAEFQGDSERALRIYAGMAQAEPALRAGALLRIARIRRRQHHWDEALAAYEELAGTSGQIAAGAPADLQARRAACDILVTVQRRSALAREAAALERDVLAGRWRLDRAAWELTAADVERWTGRPLPIAPERRLFSAVADALWADHRLESGGRRVIVVDHTPVTVLSRPNSGERVTLAIVPALVDDWVTKASAGLPLRQPGFAVLGPSDTLVAGRRAGGSGSGTGIRAPSADTGLPWTVSLASDDGGAADADLAGRRRLVSGAVTAVLLLVFGGSYFLWRVVQRELHVARLQADFVSAVSHEFRTPLASLRHIVELLDEDDELPPERRRAFYQALGRNTERLHRLVESLLDFARMERGRKPYDLRDVDAVALVVQVVADFERDVAARGFTIELDVQCSSGVSVLADQASLASALWNLLDNAVKYSGDSRAIRVAVRRDETSVAIAVSDEGLGVSVREQTQIFGKFVRGARATALGIKGTGLGLAMVAHIVRTHRGTIELVSREGAGSTFTIVLPVDSAARPFQGRVDADQRDAVAAAAAIVKP